MNFSTLYLILYQYFIAFAKKSYPHALMDCVTVVLGVSVGGDFLSTSYPHCGKVAGLDMLISDGMGTFLAYQRVK
jgi:hypothetical protein